MSSNERQRGHNQNRPSAGLGVGPRPLLVTWVHHHRQAASESLNKLLLAPISTVLTWLVLAIALALPTALLLLLDNVAAVADPSQSPARFSLLLKADVSERDADELARGLQQRVDVAVALLVPRDEALAAFAEDTGLSGLLDSLEDNPLPHTIVLSPAADLGNDRLAGLAQALGQQDLVEEVVFDTLWQERLEASLEFGRRLVFGLGLLMLVGAVLILGNTIRLAIEARREEIVVIKLIGGGDAFARRPFLYTGLWFGIGGGVLAALLVVALFLYLGGPINQLLSSYQQTHSLSGLDVVGVLNLTLVGGGLGLLSAWQASGLHLRAVEPR